MTKGSTNKSLFEIYGLKTNKKELLVLKSKKFIWQLVFLCGDHVWLCLTWLSLESECSCSVPLTLTGSKSKVCWDHNDLIYKCGIPSWLGLSQDTDTSKKTMVTLKCCYVLQGYMGTTLSHDKLHAYQHPRPRNGDKSSEDSGVRKKYPTVMHTILSLYRMHLSVYNCVYWVTTRVFSLGTLQQQQVEVQRWWAWK